MELLAISVGLGLVISIVFTEFFGIGSSGMIIPGYMALYLLNPGHIIATLLIALVTFTIVRLLSTFMIVYGKRRTALMILIGYMLGMLVQHLPWMWIEEYEVIGFIIPGLIAVWMDRQSVLQTLSSLALVSICVRLILIVTVGTELLS